MYYFPLYAAAILLALFWYCFKVWLPYSQFPSYHLEYRIPVWLFQKEKLSITAVKYILEFCDRNYEEGVVVLWFPQPYVFAFGEEAIRIIMNEPEAIDKPPMYSDVFKGFVGESVFLSNGEQYLTQRKKIQSALRLVSLKEKIPAMNKIAAALTERIRELNGSTTDETLDFLKECLLRIFLESALGMNEGKDPEQFKKYCLFIKMTEKIFEFHVSRIVFPWLRIDFVANLFPNTRHYLQLQEQAITLSEEIVQEVKTALCSRKSAGYSMEQEDPECFGQRSKLIGEFLVEEHMRDPSFTLKDVSRQLNMLLVAGYDTSANTMLWCLLLLGNHPDVQEGVYQEMMSTTNGDVHYEDLKNLEYLDCVLKETMRLYPVTPFVGRCPRKDLKCGKYTIPKNATVWIFLYKLHRNPEIYPDPEKFDPERFRTKNSRIRQWNHLPFAEGVRSCPGKVFAMMEMKIILTHIIRDFRVVSVDRMEDIGISWELTLVPDKPIRLKFISR